MIHQKNLKVRRLELLRHMLISALPAETAALTLIKGIGAKWATKLRDHGILNIQALGEAAIEKLESIRGLSSKRAGQWVEEAKSMATDPIPSTENQAPFLDCDQFIRERTPYDPYRMRRAIDLSVSDGSGDRYTVSGGLEPHRVWKKGESWLCDCVDFAKGNLCKHILSVRLHRDQSEMKAARKQGRKQLPGTIDFFELWFES